MNLVPEHKTGPLQRIYVALGVLSVAIGVVALAIPLLPTTPFLILGSYFFSKGSPRLHKKLLDDPRLGPTLRNWEAHHAIHPRAKVMAIGMMTLGMSYPFFFKPLPIPLKAMIFVSWASIALFIFTRPSGPRAEE